MAKHSKYAWSARPANLQVFFQTGCRVIGVNHEQIAAACFVAWLLCWRLKEWRSTGGKISAAGGQGAAAGLLGLQPAQHNEQHHHGEPAPDGARL